MSEPTPIRRVRADGSVDLLGHYLHRERRLTLSSDGFPLHGPGEHEVEGDLPWALQDMAPAGYLARRFATWFPELHLPSDPRLWHADDALRAVTERGHDLPGNLVVGEESWRRYGRANGRVPRDRARDHYLALVDDTLVDERGSSVGGDRPKFTLRLADGGAPERARAGLAGGTHSDSADGGSFREAGERSRRTHHTDGAGLIVKFTPPVDTLLGRRWADLLRLEAHCAATLRAHGLPAVQAEYVELGGRGFLEVERFDRLRGGGRRGAVTLFWLGASRYGEDRDPLLVVERLRAEGHLTDEDVRRLSLVHRFSASIGNTDAHLGNYALTIGDQGQVSLAPFYDVLPMVFAPRHDELPDARIGGHAPSAAPDVRVLVDDLVARVSADATLDPALVQRWLAHIG